jgi:hypothetical protein
MTDTVTIRRELLERMSAFLSRRTGKAPSTQEANALQADVTAALAAAPAPVQCVACEESPAPQNNPCAACGAKAPVQAEPASPWVAVSERLPESSGDTLIAVTPRPYDDAVSLTYFDVDGGEWCIAPGFTVTHWMPLPPAPESSK